MRNDFLFPDGGCGFKAHLSICNLDVKPQESRIATQRCGRNDTRIEPRHHPTPLVSRPSLSLPPARCSFSQTRGLFFDVRLFFPAQSCRLNWPVELPSSPAGTVELSVREGWREKKVYSFIDIFIPGIFFLLQLWRISSLPRTECTAGLHDFAYYCPLYCWKWKYATRMFTLSESLCF